MYLLSAILKRVVYPSLSAVGYLGRRRARRISIITYHGVFPSGYTVADPFLDGTLLSVEVFRRQLKILRSAYYMLSPPEFLDWLHTDRELPERAALLTCDDGLLNNLTDMVPALLEEKLSCLFFATGASVTDPYSMLWYVELYLMLAQSARRELELSLNGTNARISLGDPATKRAAWLDLLKKLSGFDGSSRKILLEEIRVELDLHPGWKSEYLENPVLRERYCVMGVPELQQLVESGMYVGAHSLTHPIPSQQSEEAFRGEMVTSRELLEQALHRPVWAFAYPFGDPDSVSQRECDMAAQAGFECAFLNVGGPLRSKVQPYALPRIHVSREMNLGEFEAHVSGFHEELRERLRGKPKSA